MKYFKLLIILTLILLVFNGCDKKNHVSNELENNIEISNLVSNNDKALIKDRLLEAGLKRENIDAFLENVSNYNDYVNNNLPFKDGFSKTPIYRQDYNKTVDEFYNKGNKLGSNCRINTFILLKDKITINNCIDDNSSILAFDKSSIENEFKNNFNDKKKRDFYTLFAPIKAVNSKNKEDQIKNIKKAFKDRGISFKKSKARMISEWFHDKESIDGDILFIGHTGVLVPYNNKLLFIEKLSFNEPYQAIILSNERQLSDYLMEKYDTEYNQDVTRPFIIDGLKILKDFRQNSKK